MDASTLKAGDAFERVCRDLGCDAPHRTFLVAREGDSGVLGFPGRPHLYLPVEFRDGRMWAEGDSLVDVETIEEGGAKAEAEAYVAYEALVAECLQFELSDQEFASFSADAFADIALLRALISDQRLKRLSAKAYGALILADCPPTPQALVLISQLMKLIEAQNTRALSSLFGGFGGIIMEVMPEDLGSFTRE